MRPLVDALYFPTNGGGRQTRDKFPKDATHQRRHWSHPTEHGVKGEKAENGGPRIAEPRAEQGTPQPSSLLLVKSWNGMDFNSSSCLVENRL